MTAAPVYSRMHTWLSSIWKHPKLCRRVCKFIPDLLDNYIIVYIANYNNKVWTSVSYEEVLSKNGHLPSKASLSPSFEVRNVITRLAPRCSSSCHSREKLLHSLALHSYLLWFEWILMILLAVRSFCNHPLSRYCCVEIWDSFKVILINILACMHVVLLVKEVSIVYEVLSTLMKGYLYS